MVEHELTDIQNAENSLWDKFLLGMNHITAISLLGNLENIAPKFNIQDLALRPIDDWDCSKQIYSKSI